MLHAALKCIGGQTMSDWMTYLPQHIKDTVNGFEPTVNNANDIVINNTLLLNKFNQYFLNGAKEIIHSARKDPVYLPDEIGGVYYQLPNCFEKVVMPEENCVILEKMGCIDLQAIKKLSKREMDCLKYLHEGQDAKGIAKSLFLSSGSVEKHFESIKNKLTCFKKTELAYYAYQLHIAGFF